MNRFPTWITRADRNSFHRLAALFLLLTMGACSVPLEASVQPLPTLTREGPPQPLRYNTYTTLEQAQMHLSFQLLAFQSGQLPQGLALASVEVWSHEGAPGDTVVATYSAESADLTLTETFAPDGMTPPQGFSYQNIRVRGQDGYFLTAGGEPVAYALLWEENEVMLTISSSGLTKEELFQLAEDLVPQGERP